VLDMIEAKIEGKEIITLSAEPPRAQVIDLMEALKDSLTKRPAKEKKPLAKAAKAVAAAPAPKRAHAGKKS
jgi:non-homologous end joining protein Ku